MIDLRSDTLTVPDEGMRQAMAQAQVGDDVYGEDPTVVHLQERIASMFGKEAALFVPSGTMGNQICLALHAGTGDEVVVESQAHIFHYENGAASTISRVQLHPVPSTDGAMPIEKIAEAIRPTAYYYPTTKLIAIETSHNRHGGTVLSSEYLTSLRNLSHSTGIPVHCDGARIWNASLATSMELADIASYFDTMSVCLSKGLGAPVGSVIIGTRSAMDRALRWRKMLGGGMRQAGVLAAAAIYALDHVLPTLSADHGHAAQFADGLESIPGIEIERWRVQTNIVRFRVTMEDEEFVRAMKDQGVLVAPITRGLMRAVFYHNITAEQTADSIRAVRSVLEKSN